MVHLNMREFLAVRLELLAEIMHGDIVNTLVFDNGSGRQGTR